MSDPRRYAAETNVPVEKSQVEIAKLLREQGCIGVQWTEDWQRSRADLRFCWPHGGAEYVARITIQMPTDETILRGCAIRHKTRDARAAWLVKEREQVARSAYRIVLIKLKADFNMVRAGMVSAVEILLPFLEDQQGRTVAELATPRLPELLGPDGATRFLPLPKG